MEISEKRQTTPFAEFAIVISTQNVIKSPVPNFEISGANLFAGILFSGIGSAAFIYGKRISSYKKMIIGGLLVFYPFLITDTLAMYVVGAALTVALFVFKD